MVYAAATVNTHYTRSQICRNEINNWKWWNENRSKKSYNISANRKSALQPLNACVCVFLQFYIDTLVMWSFHTLVFPASMFSVDWTRSAHYYFSLNMYSFMRFITNSLPIHKAISLHIHKTWNNYIYFKIVYKKKHTHFIRSLWKLLKKKETKAS